MNLRASLLVVLLIFSASAFSQDHGIPAVEGYVTRAASPSDFDVDTVRIVCDQGPGSRKGRHQPVCPLQTPALGDAATVYGRIQKKQDAVIASRIVIKPTPIGDVHGSAIIDAMPPASSVPAASGSLLVRADGYPILISSTTQATFQAPLRSLTGVTTNVWIEYTGRQRPDGVVVAQSATFTPNIIKPSEDHLLYKTDYDPSKVDPAKKQGLFSKAVKGINYKDIPPYSNPAMQARITRIGDSLIPAYQRKLPDADLTKIVFRFQLVDEKHWHDAVTLPSGVILVPYQVVQQLPDDSQLGAVLADNIACALEKQQYRAQGAMEALKVSRAAGLGGAGLAVPGLDLSLLGTGMGAKLLIRREEQQSGRVALDLMHDAGYDITQAPVAWWLLDSRKPHSASRNMPPDRTVYLYKILGTTWTTAPSNSMLAGNNQH